VKSQSNFEKYIFIISLLINILFITYAAGKTYLRISNKNNFDIHSRDTLKVDLKILKSSGTAIILTLGQSNSASFGQGSYSCHNKVYEYYSGVLYKACEPLLGAYGNGGCSVWTRLSDMLIDSGLYEKVVLLNIGRGSTDIYKWASGSAGKELDTMLEYIKKDSIKVTHVIWHQGESDNIENTTKDEYKASLRRILLKIREHGIHADFYVCIASYQPSMIDKNNGIDTIIQNAQYEFVYENKGTRIGANTDLLNLASDRYDGVHFSKRGLDKYALDMYKKIVDEKKIFIRSD
jgi:hypothetical protein